MGLDTDESEPSEVSALEVLNGRVRGYLRQFRISSSSTSVFFILAGRAAVSQRGAQVTGGAGSAGLPLTAFVF
jgi:hypothetical protein